MAAKAYLAIDLGAESGRTMLGVLDGEQLALHELHRFANVPLRLPSGWHWNLTGLWSEILTGVRQALSWSRDNSVPLVSLGVDTWGVDYALIGQSGELLGLPHCYRDERNHAAFERVLSRLGRDRLYEATGIQFMALNTLYQLAAQHEAEPEVVSQAHRLLFMPDLMHYFFTGQTAVEASIASTSQMIDPRSGAWALPILEELGLPTQMLGPVVPSGSRMGPLLPQLADELGADRQMQIITPGAHDTASAVAAVPAEADSDWCYLSSGTWSLMGVELEGPCLTASAREAPFTNEGGIGGSIRFLKNITGLWLVQECRRHFELQGLNYNYEQLITAAEASAPFRTLINPEYDRFSSPGDMPLKIAEFACSTAQPEPDGVGQFVRCCLESLALTYRRTLEQLESVLGRTFDVIHIVGGGGRNQLLNQMTADAAGRRVVVGPYEATAMGNVLVQALGNGDLRDRAHLRQIVAATVEPDTYEPRQTSDWDQAYVRFRAFVP